LATWFRLGLGRLGRNLVLVELGYNGP